MKSKDMIMVKDDPTLASAAGAMVFWRLASGLKREALEDAWTLDVVHLPPEVTTLAALRTVMVRVASKHKAFVRQYGTHALAIAKGQTEDAGFGKQFPIIVQGGLAGFPHAHVQMMGRLSTFARRANERVGKKKNEHHITIEVCSADSAFDAIRDEILGTLPEARETYESNDVGAWLVAQAKRLNAVPLRDGGGIYFVPKFALDEWRQIIAALRSASPDQIIHEIPALDSRGAIAAIFDAITIEATTTIETMDKALAEVGPRGLKTLKADALLLDEKMTQYEGLLGLRLVELREKLEKLQFNLGVAVLAKEEDAAE